MEKVDEYPDIIIGCAGGGSNLGGLISDFMKDKLTGKANPYFIAVEPAACPSLLMANMLMIFVIQVILTPLAKMYTLGSGFIPSSIHAGGLCVIMVCHLLYQNYITMVILMKQSIIPKPHF